MKRKISKRKTKKNYVLTTRRKTTRRKTTRRKTTKRKMVYLIYYKDDQETSRFSDLKDLQNLIIETISDNYRDYIINKYGDDFYGDLDGITGLTKTDLRKLIVIFTERYIVYDIGNDINKLVGKSLYQLNELSEKDFIDIALTKQ